MEIVSIPLNIVRNFNLSPRARLIWAELTLLDRDTEQKFVVQTKNLSAELKICASTLRRALKILIQEDLIEHVGTTKQRHKIYKFKSVTPPGKKCPRDEEEAISSPEVKALVKEVAAKLVVKAESKKVVEPEPTPPDPQALKNPPGKILRISYKLTRQLTEADKVPLSVAASYVPYIELWRSEFPKLNGENGKPLLDEHMCNYFAFHYSFERNGFQVLRWMKEDFRRYSEKTFVPAEDMNVEWVDPDLAKFKRV